MKTFTTFVFESWEWVGSTLQLHYSLEEEVHFTETWDFSGSMTLQGLSLDHPALQKASEGLFLMAGISYYKAALPPQIIVKNTELTDSQAEFFEKTYLQGLGEMIYRNGLTPPKIHFPNKKIDQEKAVEIPELSGTLIPLGGGKDSLLTIELLKASLNDNPEIGPLSTWTAGAYTFFDQMIRKTEIPHHKALRTIAPTLLELNAQGAYNGHVPISAIWAFASVLSALLSGKKYVALSNEASASIPNTVYQGLSINHQYSKSLEFEQDFQHYIEQNISSDVQYFSFLRPLSELRIAELFSQEIFQKYKTEFSSCNRNFHITKNERGEIQNGYWCKKCAKCAFVALILAPFIPKEDLESLFGPAPFKNPDILQYFPELLGLEAIKPFECVGTTEESREALRLAFQTGHFPELALWMEKVNPLPDFDRKAFHPHALPQTFLQTLLHSSHTPVLIYGYGVEGQSSEHFLKSQNIPFEIYDEKKPEYSDKKNTDEFGLILLSPGINPNKLSIQEQEKCTSNTALFLSFLNPKDRAKLIGITGTKGKSMTAKLTYETLQKAGLKVEIAGNFGTGLLDLLEIMPKLDYLVVELSSYQLNGLKESFPIALCTNLYEDHLDWHGSIENYHEAKSHLWAFQKPQDHLFIPEHQKDHPLFKTPGTIQVCPPASKELFPEDSIWRSEHSLQNFGLVEQLVKTLSLKHPNLKSAFIEACKTLEALPHRLEHFATIGDVKFYDDAISTNIRSTLAAIKFFDQSLSVLLIGGQDRHQDFSLLAQIIKTDYPHLFTLVLPGETQTRIVQSFEKASVPHFACKSLEEAVEEAFSRAQPNTIVLLSPAAPSFDLYQNYQEKGKAFQKEVTRN